MAGETPVRSLGGALALAAALVVVDAFVLNQGAIALLVAAWQLLGKLPATFLIKAHAPVRMQRLRNIGIYFAAAILVFVCNGINNDIARSRADRVVAAVKAFHAKQQRYPKNLQELVPDFLPEIPAAKYALMFNRFTYLASDKGPVLFYADLPPYGRPTFEFARNEWVYLD